MVYEAWIYQLYNLILTTFPVVWFSLFDFEHEKEVFLSDPRLYRIGIRGTCFSTKIFWKWFVYGAL